MGKIKTTCESNDGKEVSFIVEMENGQGAIRHKCHLCHNSRTSEIKVRFQLPNENTLPEKNDEDKAQTQTPKEESGRVNSIEKIEGGTGIPDRERVGVMTRSKSKLNLSLPELAVPKKSCLKGRNNE